MGHPQIVGVIPAADREHDAQIRVMRLQRSQTANHITRLGVIGFRIPGALQIAVNVEEREINVGQLFGFGRCDVGYREGHD
ncbi:hypothetical protein D3C72_2262610 [compost metagenome]